MDMKIHFVLADINRDCLNVGKPMVRPLVIPRLYEIPELDLLWFFGGG